MLEASRPCFVQTNFSFNILAAKNLQTSVNYFNESPANTPGLHSCEVRCAPGQLKGGDFLGWQRSGDGSL